MNLFPKIVVFSLTVILFTASSSCRKADLDPDYKFTIIVKTLSDSTRVANVFVELIAPVPGSRVDLDGFTDENGEVDFEYDEEATLLIRATRGPQGAYLWIGCNNIRLLDDRRATQTVYIRPYDPEVEGC